jgi:hypothetical protein
MESIFKKIGGPIELPEFKERNLYMYKMGMNKVIMPEGFKDYEPTIESVLSKLNDRNDVCYITIDEKHIKNETHRRSGIHVDFNWYENIQNHADRGDESGRGSHSPGTHQSNGGERNVGIHRAIGRHSGHRRDMDKGGVLLLSNYDGCRAWKGHYDDSMIGEGGCCKNVDVSGLESAILKSGYVYYLNSLGIHESIHIPTEVKRSLIRINFHPNYDFKN